MYLYKENAIRVPERSSHIQPTLSTRDSNGSVPKRYQSVFIERTPLIALGIRSDDSDTRLNPPSNRTQSPAHRQPLHPVKEFLTNHSTVDQELGDRRRSTSRTNSVARSQTDATVQSVNSILTRTFTRLHQEPTRAATINGRSTPMYAPPMPIRAPTARIRTQTNLAARTSSTFYYPLASAKKGPLPADLMSKRTLGSTTTTTTGVTSTTSLANSQNRFSNSVGPVTPQRPITPAHEAKSNESGFARASTPFRTPTRSLQSGLHRLDELKCDSLASEEHSKRSYTNMHEFNRPALPKAPSDRQLRTPRPDLQHRSLPEVSVDPQIQSAVQPMHDRSPLSYDLMQNSFSAKHTKDPVLNFNAVENYATHHQIQVIPSSKPKRMPSPIPHQPPVDPQPRIVIQHQRPSSRQSSTTKTFAPPRQDSSDEADAGTDDTIRAQMVTGEQARPTRRDGSASTVRTHGNSHERTVNHFAVPPRSQSIQELNVERAQQQQQDSYSGKVGTDVSTKRARPPGRLKNYGDASESNSASTEVRSREEDALSRHSLRPSDLGSETWSDLTSEFNDSKLRKDTHVRTSTPNVAQFNSSLNSREVGYIRKQLTDLQGMYTDLLQLLDLDVGSSAGYAKSSVSSHTDHQGRRHRSRRGAPVIPAHLAHLDMKEIHQRFSKLESSIVALANSLAKLSTQIQMQLVIDDEVKRLRQEVVELRQHWNHQSIRPPSAAAGDHDRRSNGLTPSAHPSSRLISPNVQHLAAMNTSKSQMPSTSTIQRTNSVIDPRQARKIEQFFGADAMLRYFLSLLHCEEYLPLLEREKIGFYELPYINEKKLQSFGIPYDSCARMVYESQQYFISLLTMKSNGIDV